MTDVTRATLLFNPVSGHYVLIGGNKLGGQGGMVARDLTTGVEVILRGDTDTGTATLLPDVSGAMWLAWKDGRVDPSVRFSINTAIVGPDLSVIAPPSVWPNFGFIPIFQKFGVPLTTADPQAATTLNSYMWMVCEGGYQGANNCVLLFRYNPTAGWDKFFALDVNCGTPVLARLIAGADGTLHVLWRRGAGSADIFASGVKGDKVVYGQVDVSNEPNWDEKQPNGAAAPDGTCYIVWPGNAGPGNPVGVALSRYDAGKGWVRIGESIVGTPWASFRGVAVAAAEDNATVFIAVATESSAVKLFISRDRGQSWRGLPGWETGAGTGINQLEMIYHAGNLEVGCLDQNSHVHVTSIATGITPAPAPNPQPQPTPVQTVTIIPGFQVKETGKFYQTGTEIKL